MYYAVLNGKSVSAPTAIPGMEYHCEYCKERLFLKQGSVRRPHFAHYQSAVECEMHDRRKYDAEQGQGDKDTVSRPPQNATPTVQLPPEPPVIRQEYIYEREESDIQCERCFTKRTHVIKREVGSHRIVAEYYRCERCNTLIWASCPICRIGKPRQYRGPVGFFIGCSQFPKTECSGRFRPQKCKY